MTTFGMPPAYVGAPLVQPSADAGTCILTPNSRMIRPKIGGMYIAKGKKHIKRSRGKRKGSKKSRRKYLNHNNHINHNNHNNYGGQNAGFLPSIGEPFAAAAGKYVAPIALYGLYKFLNKTKTGRRTRKSR